MTTSAYPGLAYPGTTFPGVTVASGLQSVGAYSFRVITAGNQYAVPDFRDMQIGFEYSDVSGCKFAYTKGGINYDNIVDGSVLVAYRDGVEGFNSRWLLFAGEGDGDPGAPYDKWIGRNLFDVFRKAVVQPPGTDVEVVFTTSTPGGILNSLFTAAQARSAMTGITWTFSSTVDSAGAAWDNTKLLNLKYKAGIKYLDIVRDLVDKGIIECRFNGYEFQVYVEGTMGAVTTAEILAGEDTEELPYKWTSEDRAKFSMTIGDEGVIVKKTDGAIPNGTFGVEEQAITQGGTTDVGTLTLINDYYLSRNSTKLEQLTRKVKIRPGRPVPNVDYKVGDWIRERTMKFVNGQLQTDSVEHRVRAIVIGVDDDGSFQSASLVLNDRILEADIRNSRKIDGITGGVSGSGGSPVTTPPPSTDATIPNPPTGLLLSTNVYVDSSGRSRGILSANWTAPTQNTDLSTISDLKEYEVNWKKNADTAWQAAIVNTASWITSDLDVATSYNVRVRAWDNSGHASTWTATGTLSTATDTTPPAVASAPSLTVSRGTVIVAWDGQTAAAGSMDPDFSHVEVHRSTVNNFTPDSTTVADRLFARGTTVITGQPYDATWYYKFVSVDTNGNKSAGSAQASCVTTRLVGGDLANLTIAAGNMMANSVETDKLAAGSATMEKLAFGVLRTNLVPNAGFEDDYAFDFWDLYGAGGPGNVNRWRTVSGSPYRTTGNSRSGAKALRLDADATGVGAPVEASTLSGTFQIKNGKKYKIVVYACAVISPAKLALQLYTGSTPGGIEVFSSPSIQGLGPYTAADVPVIAGSTVTPLDYKQYAGEFTGDTDEWAGIRVMNYNPASLSGLIVDDISIVEMGIGGATEITSAGIRLFDNDGEECGAFVSNRPNFFTVSRDGIPVASISGIGAAKFTGINTDSDPTVAGFPLMGGLLNYQSPMTEGGLVKGHLDKVGRGVVAFGNLPNNAFTGTSYQRELSFIAEPGRSYKVTYGGGQAQLSLANTSMGVYFGYATPATDGGDAAGQASTTHRHNYTSVDVANQQVALPAMSFLLRCNKNGLASGGEIRAGRNRLKVGVHASTGTLTINQLHDFFIEDIGPDIPDTDVTNTASTALASAVQTWTSTWYCDNSEAYDGTGTARTDTTDLIQGYYSSTNGRHFSLLLFGGNAFAGEGVSVATAVTGAAIVRARVFIYFRKWHYPNGGTAYIFTNTATALANTAPSGVAITQAMNTQSGGMWVDITSQWDTTKRGIWLGRPPTDSLDYYATASSHADTIDRRPILELTYRK